MYPYIKLADETEITHSHIINNNNLQEIEVHFERPTENGFDMARCSLPSYKWLMCEGYSQNEIVEFELILRNHAHLLFKYAGSGGINIA